MTVIFRSACDRLLGHGKGKGMYVRHGGGEWKCRADIWGRGGLHESILERDKL